MTSADGVPLAVQRELATAAGAGLDEVRFLERFAFYREAEQSFVVVRTGETRTYANVLVRKGVVSEVRRSATAP
jgi:L-fucose mutarotase